MVTPGQDRWPYLGLPALDAVRYVEEENLLGVALIGFMRSAEEDRPQLKAQALRRLAESGLSPFRLFLLMSLVEAYLPLDGPGIEQYQALLVTKEYQVVLKAAETSFERGERIGLLLGRQQTIERLLVCKFGPLTAVALQRLRELSADQLDELAQRLLTANSLQELGLPT